MAWKKNSSEMVELMDRAMAEFECQSRPMFGCPAYFLNGNMFAGLHQDNPILRLSKKDREDILAAFDEAGQFEPMAGRPMKEYVTLPESIYGDPSLLQEWIARAHQYVESLPPKVK